ncbi:hypothetical protein J7Q84_06320 [Bacillus sp. 165]|nr:hypothetical protein [Bacillus sp. 165]
MIFAGSMVKVIVILVNYKDIMITQAAGTYSPISKRKTVYVSWDVSPILIK